jgi:hypothetical protein
MKLIISIQTLNELIKLVQVFHFLMFLLKIKLVYSLHQYITKKQLNLTSYYLNRIIHVMSLGILSKLLFFVQSDIFNIEQRSIKLMLLYHGFVFHLYFFNTNPIHFSYPPRYIYTRFKEFFRRYTSSSSWSSIQPFFKNENHFNTIRSQLLEQQTSAEKQI